MQCFETKDLPFAAKYEKFDINLDKLLVSKGTFKKLYVLGSQKT